MFFILGPGSRGSRPVKTAFTINRFAAGGPERHFTILPAFITDSLMHGWPVVIKPSFKISSTGSASVEICHGRQYNIFAIFYIPISNIKQYSAISGNIKQDLVKCIHVNDSPYFNCTLLPKTVRSQALLITCNLSMLQ